MPTAYLSLGSNLGDRGKNLIRALSLLSTEVNLDKASSVYETEPVGYKEQPLFLNLACQVTTNLNPWKLLHLAKTIENKMGRIPSKQINAPRPIDIDILFYNKQIINSKNLTVPHPHLAKRAFVLIPLSEIAAELIHPQLGKSIAALVNNVRGQSGVRKYN